MNESLETIKQQLRAARRDFIAAARALSSDTVTQPGSPERTALVVPVIAAYNRAADLRSELQRVRRAMRSNGNGPGPAAR